MTPPRDIDELARGWESQAPDLEYLGEIAVDPERMCSLLRRLGEQHIDYGRLPSYRFVLAVLAVNFAYYQEQDEEYRGPFLAAMGRPEQFAYWNNELGPAIERVITDLTGVSARWGPYRYVGPVLEHAGIPRSRIPKFVELLAHLKNQPGWEIVGPATRNSVQRAVAAVFGQSSRYGRFLESDKGIELVGAAGRLLLNHLDGLVTEEQLRSAAGFREGFLEDVIRRFDPAVLDELRQGSKQRLGKISAARFVRPALRLDTGLNSLVLTFSTQALTRYRITLRQGRRLPRVDYAEMEIGRDIDFGEEYVGQWHDQTSGQQGDWHIPAWRPRGGDWALFTLDGDWVCHSRLGISPEPGQYLIVFDAGLTDKAGEVDRLGRLETGHRGLKSTYEILGLELVEGQDICGTGTTVRSGEGQPLPTMSAMGIADWCRYAGVDAVWHERDARSIKLSDWNERATQRLMLLARVGDDRQRLRVGQASPNGEAFVDLACLRGPGVGEIWLEEAGRIRGAGGKGSRLTFAIWPRTEIDSPAGLHEVDEPLTIRVRCEDSEVRFETNAACADEQGVYVVQPGESRIDGHLVHARAAERLSVTIPVYRSRFHSYGAAHEGALVLTPYQLQRLHGRYLEQDFTECRFELSALPNRTVELSIVDLLNRSSSALMSGKTGPSGWRRLYVNEFLDALRSAQPTLGRFQIDCDGQRVQADAWFAHPGRLSDVPDAVFEDLDAPECLRAHHDVVHNRPVAWERMTGLPDDLGRFLGTLALAAEAFDGVAIPEALRKAAHRAAPRLFARIGEVLSGVKALDESPASCLRAGELQKCWQRLRPERILRRARLRVRRWNEQLAEASRVLQERSQLGGWLDKLRQVAHGSRQVITSIPKGLRDAAREYGRSQGTRQGLDCLDAAIATLQGVQDIPESGLWAECRHVLRVMAFLHRGEVSIALGYIGDCPELQQLKGAFVELLAIRALIRGDEAIQVTEGLSASLAEVSPRTDDALIAQGLTGRTDAWQDPGNASWLGAWLGWRWNVQYGDAGAERTLLERARQLTDQIPDRMDRRRLVKEIKNGRAEPWD